MLWNKLFLVSFALLMSCNTTNAVAFIEPPMGIQDFEVLLNTPISNLEARSQQIINTQKDLESIFQKINATQSPGHDVPQIDFETEMVAVLTMGSKNSGGYQITVGSILKNENELVIYYTEIAPKPFDMVTSVMTSPCIIIKTAKTNLPVRFEATSQ